MNFSNALTLLRLLLTVFFVIVLSIGRSGYYYIAFGTFALAALTDWLDGYIARNYESCTNFGRLMDPLADKILVAAALISLIPVEAFPAWVVIVIIAREFLVTGLRLLAMDRNIVLSADSLGKKKTCWQMLMLLFFLFLMAAKDYSKGPWIVWCWVNVGPWLVGVTLFLTVYSGISYIWKNKTLLK